MASTETTSSLTPSDLPPGRVGRAGRWAVANRAGDLTAVSRRCRHQLGDLSRGSVDAEGCLVCPWHGARYDLDSGAMVTGPKGFLTYVGKVPAWYAAAIVAVGRVAKLRTASVAVEDGRLVVRR